MFIPKVNIRNVHLLEINGLPTPVTSRHAQGHGILHHYLVVCSSQSEQTTERNEYYMANQHPWHVGRLPWTLRRKGHQEIGFDLDGLLRLQVRRYRSQYRGGMPPACSSSMA
jgi:hypothetical protein